MLPAGADLAFTGSRLRVGAGLAVASEAARAESLLAQAGRAGGDERLALLRDALALLDRGTYLAGLDARWIDERRELLARAAADARHEAARSATTIASSTPTAAASAPSARSARRLADHARAALAAAPVAADS